MNGHLNLGVTDLERSVVFYSTLLAAKPAKRLDDYALVITDDPGMRPAHDLRATVAPTTRCAEDLGSRS